MQALILVGGEGTRLRPLTTVVPKPVIQLVDRPFMAYMLEWLARHGVDRAVMSCGYKPEGIRAVLGDGAAHGVTITYVEEPTPMGTGGAMKYCEDLLEDEFLMLNGDVLTDIDVSAQLAQHHATGARGTLGLYPVEDPSAYGLVRLNEDNSVRGFLEKPTPEEIDTDLISAGIYLLRKDVLGLLEPGKPASIERDVFPRLVGEGLYGYAARDAYWMDIGTPERYLQASFDILEGTVATAVTAHVDPEAQVEGELAGSVLIERGARLAAGARALGRVVLGEGVSIGAGSTLESTVLLAGASVGEDCTLRGCVVAEEATIGDRCELGGHTVVGRGARVGAGNMLGAGALVFPGVELPERAIKV